MTGPRDSIRDDLDEAHREDEVTDLGRDISRLRAKLSATRRQLRGTRRDLDLAEERLGVHEQLSEPSPPFAIKASKRKPSGKSESTAVFMWSDWHIEEPIESGTMFVGDNSWSIPEAEEAIDNLAHRSVEMIDRQRTHTRIEKAVICLGGDFISGHIHEELKWATTMTPIEACDWALPRIEAALNHIADKSGLESLIVPCVVGNHGRDTTKIVLGGTAYKRSYEFSMYCQLARMFRDHPVIKFDVSKSPAVVVDVYGMPIRFHHGNEFRYRDGVGGISIPGNKLIDKWNRSADTPAMLDIIGHFHGYALSWGRCIVNGSLPGWSAFGALFGLPREDAIQAFSLISEKYQQETVRSPIFARR